MARKLHQIRKYRKKHVDNVGAPISREYQLGYDTTEALLKNVSKGVNIGKCNKNNREIQLNTKWR